MPHIGHTYSTIVADVIRRYKRMRGFEVFMTTGADEHGVNVERSAQKAGKSPQEFSTEIAVQWRRLWDDLEIPGDEFIRTTDEKHHRTVQWLFKRCRENGFIEKGHYTGQYCVHDNAYVVDAGPGDACPDCGRPTETVTEENYFFKLSGFQQKLLDFYAAPLSRKDRNELKLLRWLYPEPKRNLSQLDGDGLEMYRNHPFEDELLAPDGNFYPRHSKLRPAGAADDLLVNTGDGPPISPVIPCNAPATDLGCSLIPGQ